MRTNRQRRTAARELRAVGCAWPGLGGTPCIVDVGGEPYAHKPRYRAALFAGLANLFISDGAPGPVLEIEVSRRTGAEGSLPQAMRAALAPLAAARSR